MIRKIAALLVALLVALGVMLSPASPARATLADCWNGTVCLFAHANYANPIWRQVTDDIPGCRSLVGTGWNNVTSSWANNYTFGVIFRAYDASNCTGEYLSLSGDYTQNLGGSSWNDKISSVQVILL